MVENEIDLRSVSHITTDAIGKPGKRVFYIQAWEEQRSVTLIVEKIQIQSLAVGYEQFLEEVHQRFPDLQEASSDYIEEKMHIHPPVDPLFRIGELGLGYDSDSDLVILVAKEMVSEEDKNDEMRVVRYWCTRSQVRAMCHWGIDVASRGRPLCPQCGEPMDPAGHFCPKKNGHKH
jgi:uncharacterized repeat protein (TIGR03847 family)